MSKKKTPLMIQYENIKRKYPESMLLFRVGDFYETFGEDAFKASKILNLDFVLEATHKRSACIFNNFL